MIRGATSQEERRSERIKRAESICSWLLFHAHIYILSEGRRHTHILRSKGHTHTHWVQCKKAVRHCPLALVHRPLTREESSYIYVVYAIIIMLYNIIMDAIIISSSKRVGGEQREWVGIGCHHIIIPLPVSLPPIKYPPHRPEAENAYI